MEFSAAAAYCLLDLELQGLAARARAATVAVGDWAGHGSGILWGDTGLIATNNHVVRAPGVIRVTSLDAEQQSCIARVVARDVDNDIALLRPPDEFLRRRTGLRIAEDGEVLRAGELVIAVGNPHGERGVVTLGIVSRGRSDSGLRTPAEFGSMQSRPGARFTPELARELVVADIVLAPGNSGGPLLNAGGEVVGINSMMASPGVGFAVPGRLVNRLIRYAAASRPRVELRSAA